jgi:hypothetical protein
LLRYVLALISGTLVIQLKESIKDFDPRRRRYSEPFGLTITVESMAERDVMPSVCGHRRLVDLFVQVPRQSDLPIALDL